MLGLRRTSLFALVAVLALGAGPAGAGTQDDPEIDDGCGGTGLWVTAFGERQEIDTDRPPRVDVERVWFSSVREHDEGNLLGVDVALDLCGEVGEPVFGTMYNVSWWLDEDLECFGRLELSRAQRGDNTGTETVWSSGLTRQCRLDAGAVGTYRVQERANVIAHVDVDGPRITWRLRGSDQPHMGLLLDEGTIWAAPWASASDGAGWFGRVAPEGPIGASLGPAHDWTEPGRGYVVGQRG